MSVGSGEVPPVPLAIVRNATFSDLVTARQADLDFTVEARSAQKDSAASSTDQIQLLLKSAGGVIANEGLENRFILIKRDNASDANNLPWMVQICADEEVRRVVADDSEWMIFGNQYWEGEDAD